MGSDPGNVLLGGIVGSGSLLLAWAIVQLGQALAGLTNVLKDGVTVTINQTGEVTKGK